VPFVVSELIREDMDQLKRELFSTPSIGLFNLLAVLIFGIYADGIPGKWMPRPDYTFLSWSYLFTVGSMIASFFAGQLTRLTCWIFDEGDVLF
jgi:hypothetical protein